MLFTIHRMNQYIKERNKQLKEKETINKSGINICKR